MTRHFIPLVASLASLASVADAASIGINFGAGRANAALVTTDLAGAVAQGNWNNAEGASGMLALVDSSGAASGASISWATDEQWSIGGPGADANGTLLNGWVSENGGDPSALDITGIPYAVYDLYVYMNHDRATEDTEINGPFGTFLLHENDTDITAAVTLVQQTATAQGDISQLGNYAVFSGLSGADLNLTLGVGGFAGSNTRAPINGLQIVEVPEPTGAVLALFGGGFLLLLRRRRRAW